MSEPSGRLTRLRLLLVELYFEIAYKKGSMNHHGDALSRLLTGSPTVDPDEDDYEFPIFSTTVNDQKEEADFVEVEYDKIDNLLAKQETSSKDVQFT